jgi:hypothetical protein
MQKEKQRRLRTQRALPKHPLCSSVHLYCLIFTLQKCRVYSATPTRWNLIGNNTDAAHVPSEWLQMHHILCSAGEWRLDSAAARVDVSSGHSAVHHCWQRVFFAGSMHACIIVLGCKRSADRDGLETTGHQWCISPWLR